MSRSRLLKRVSDKNVCLFGYSLDSVQYGRIAMIVFPIQTNPLLSAPPIGSTTVCKKVLAKSIRVDLLNE